MITYNGDGDNICGMGWGWGQCHGDGVVNSSPCQSLPSIVTMAVSVAVCEILSVKEWRNLENQVRDRSKLLKIVPLDRPCATFYWSAIVNIALSCTIFELFDV